MLSDFGNDANDVDHVPLDDSEVGVAKLFHQSRVNPMGVGGTLHLVVMVVVVVPTSVALELAVPAMTVTLVIVVMMVVVSSSVVVFVVVLVLRVLHIEVVFWV